MSGLPPICFIGAGNMGSAIIAGLRGLDPVPTITVCDPSPAIRERHAAAGLPVAEDPQLAAASQLVLLAVKPQAVDQVLATLHPVLGPKHLVISILAGTTTARIEAGLQPGVRVVRSMPNTPMAIGRGMVAICPGQAASAQDLTTAEAVFSAAAAVLRVEEGQMDAVTAISGSGPAYLFRFAEAQLAAAQALGFDREQAALLVGQTIEGSIAYLRSQDGFPAALLREQVTSPGGTTAAALQVLEEAAFGELITRALTAARDRSIELAG